MAYASKKYMGKDVEGFEGVGRFWGVLNRKALPVSKTLCLEVAEVVLVKIRRIFRRLLKEGDSDEEQPFLHPILTRP